ncbi:MAG TPA: hypothetical protein VHU81_10180 [Thermoanaerobaculia bacterium]|jgi:hypothetical protein|nr:hypothetical protein [Thermoanaerobaculia bacterium]
MDNGQSNRVGQHITYFEDPDIIYMKLIGEVTAAEGVDLNRLHRDFGRGRSHVFLLFDLSELEKIDAGVRKEAGATLKMIPMRGAAIFGAPMKARVLAKLILTAMNLFKGEDEKAPVQFVDSEADARAFIDKRRREVAARQQAASA